MLTFTLTSLRMNRVIGIQMISNRRVWVKRGKVKLLCKVAKVQEWHQVPFSTIIEDKPYTIWSVKVNKELSRLIKLVSNQNTLSLKKAEWFHMILTIGTNPLKLRRPSYWWETPRIMELYPPLLLNPSKESLIHLSSIRKTKRASIHL
jgi:hypothetical protein